jgi:hypothetical protein
MPCSTIGSTTRERAFPDNLRFSSRPIRCSRPHARLSLKREWAELVWILQSVWRLKTVQKLINAGDFRLLSRRSLEALKKMREEHRFIRGMVGFLSYIVGA